MVDWPLVVVLVVAGVPGAVALVLVVARRPVDAVVDGQLEEVRGLSRAVVDAELAAIKRQLGELKRGRREERQELRSLRDEVEGLRRGVAALLAQVRAAGLVPVWEPAVVVEGGGGQESAGADGARGARVALVRRLARHFNAGELEDLVFGLGVEDGSEVWNGAASLSGRARELVLWAERNGRLEELLGVCRELRRGVRW